MRIPICKIYRAFPELDRFSDEQCERYVRRATRVAFRKQVGRLLLAVVAGLFVFVVGIFAGFVMLPVLLPADGTSWSGSFIIITYACLLVALPIIGGLMVRDFLLRRAIAGRLKIAKCPECEYSLLGLPIAGDGVVCPECGEEIDLEEHGLTPEDLIGALLEEAATTS